MKLIKCNDCESILNLTVKIKKCECGKSKGQYIDQINAIVEGPCTVIGFSNTSLMNAELTAEIVGEEDENPVEFKAFVIPVKATDVTRIEN